MSAELCAFCRGTHPADLDHCICGNWTYATPPAETGGVA